MGELISNECKYKSDDIWEQITFENYLNSVGGESGECN